VEKYLSQLSGGGKRKVSFTNITPEELREELEDISRS